MEQQQHDWLMAALTPGIGAKALLGLVQRFGDLSSACAASQAQLAALLGTPAATALKNREAEEACRQALQWAARHPHGFLLTLADHDYPPQLAQIDSPPSILFGLGRRELLSCPMLAIVGSRNAFEPDCATAEDFAGQMAGHGYTVVSGLASGIDSAAHRGALRQPASSIAVIGTGIDRVYPAANKALAQALARDGLILSEFALGAAPLARHFPRRNRIIAGLARGCLVVAASLQSGSLITARQALDAGRDVMAIPGSIHNPQARGCHWLIKQGACLVETANDVLDEIGRLEAGHRPVLPAPAENPSPILAAMGYEPVALDTLCTKLGLTAAELYAMLLQLELEGRVASLPGGRFQRLRH